MKRSLFACMMFAGMTSTLLTGCMDDANVYNPNAVQERYDNAWSEVMGDIDPNQTWNTSTRCTANVSINEDALSDYEIRLYTADPLHDSSAKLLASTNLKTNASGAASTSFTMDVAIAQATIYAVRIDNHNRCLMQPVEVNSNSVNVKFGSTGAATRTDADGDGVPDYEPPYINENAVESALAGYTQVTRIDQDYSGNNIPSFYSETSAEKIAWIIEKDEKLPYLYYGNHSRLTHVMYVIKKGGKLDFNNNNILYVDSKIQQFDVVVENGGEFVMTGEGSLTSARLCVLPGGMVTGNTLRTGLAQGNTDGIDGIYNAGTIDVNTVYMQHGNIYNNGVFKAKNIEVPNASTFVNTGRVECTTFGATSDGCGTLMTNCYFRCTESMLTGDLVMGKNAAIECPTIEARNNVVLNENSILRASSFMRLLNTKIQAPSSGHALISTPTLDYNCAPQGDGTLSGNVYVEYNTMNHNSGGESETAVGWLNDDITGNNANNYSSAVSLVGEAPLTISSNTTDETPIADADCVGKGNTPSNPNPPTTITNPDAQPWIIACEDLGSMGDFDFNDVVFSVSHVAGSTEATVTPLAAGGIYAARIYYNGTNICENNEIHAMLNGEKNDDDSYKMLNTNRKTNSGNAVTITVPANYSVANHGFSISVMKDGNTVYATINEPGQGEAPQMILIDGSADWAWPKEGVNIAKAYPKFGEWGANYKSNENWYLNPENGGEYVVK